MTCSVSYGRNCFRMEVRLETEAGKATRRVLQRQFRQSLESHTTIPVERPVAESNVVASPRDGTLDDRPHPHPGAQLQRPGPPYRVSASITLAAARSAVPCGVTVVD